MTKRAKIYTLADQLLAHLQGDENIKPYVMGAIFAEGTQQKNINETKAKYSGCVTLSILPSLNTTPEPGRAAYKHRNGQLLITVYSSTKANKLTDWNNNADEFTAWLMESVIARIGEWTYGKPGTYDTPGISDELDADISRLTDIRDVTARCVIVTVPYSFHKPTNQ